MVLKNYSEKIREREGWDKAATRERGGVRVQHFCLCVWDADRSHENAGEKIREHLEANHVFLVMLRAGLGSLFQCLDALNVIHGLNGGGTTRC